MSSSWSFGDLHTVSGLLANFLFIFFSSKKVLAYRWVGYVGYTTWLSPGGTVVRCQVLVAVMGEVGCSVRGTDLAAGSLARRWVFFLMEMFQGS